MLESDNVFGLLSAWVDDLSAPSDHKTLLPLHHLLVLSQIPLRREGETGIRLLDAAHLGDFLVKYFNFVLHLLERVVVSTFSVALKQLDILL